MIPGHSVPPPGPQTATARAPRPGARSSQLRTSAACAFGDDEPLTWPLGFGWGSVKVRWMRRDGKGWNGVA